MRSLVLSLGDPAGIGPEIVAKAWAALKDQPDLAFCVLGDADLLRTQGLPVQIIAEASQGQAAFANALPVLNRPVSAEVMPGQPDPRHAPHILDWIETGVAMCLSGEARALVTVPIAKSVLYATGFGFPGHTEYLAELCKSADGHVPQPVMMLTAKDLRVVLASIHIPLAVVPSSLTTAHLVKIARITHAALIRDFAIPAPRLVMAGLNPHAGEDGTIGREEIDILKPAITQLRDASDSDLQSTIDITGPHPADTLFHDDARKGYDAALCMYHDQGLIPLKTLDFWGGVNITLGLPIVRTSPDHGTGFTIAGQGIARADSLIEAIRTADRISRNRGQYNKGWA